MSKAKIASKNNPEGRAKAKEYLLNGKKIKPLKLITDKQSFFAAEYDGSGEIVMDSKGNAMTWRQAKLLCA